MYIIAVLFMERQTRKSILLRLLDAHVPLREYIKKSVISPWYNYDVERAIVERNIAYRVWRCRKPPADRTRYREQRRKVNYIARKLKKIYMARFLDPDQLARKLWRNLVTIEIKKTIYNNVLF
jgi:hypothetical protein